MCTPVTPNQQIYKCDECDKNFTRKYNLTRHIVRFHKNDECKNVAVEDTNVAVEDTNVAKHQCPRCYNTFSHKWCLTRHLSVCKGLQKTFECKKCLKKFRTEVSQNKHCKTCIEKNKPGTINIGTQNNINTQNIETQNNNNNIIVVYNKYGSTPFTTDHLTVEDFKKILELASPHIDSRTITEFSRKLLSNPENMCIKKKDLKTSHSQVHTGDNNWETHLDSVVYPKLANDMANEMFEIINAKRRQLKKEMFDKLRDFVDYMADNGYINTDDKDREKEIRKEYKTFVKGLKLIVYGNTKTV